MELLGVTEVAEALGLSKQRLAIVRKRPEFPAPEAQLAQGPVWSAEKIHRWAEIGRQPIGRPQAERVRRRLGHHYELEEPMSDPASPTYRRAVDLTALMNGRHPQVVNVRVLDFHRDQRRRQSAHARLLAIQQASPAHVTPVLHVEEGSAAGLFYAIPLHRGALADEIKQPTFDGRQAVTTIRQICQGARHLLATGGGVGFSLDPAYIVQYTNPAWHIADLQPSDGPPDSTVLATEFSNLVARVVQSSQALDGVVRRGFEWLQYRLTTRPFSSPSTCITLVERSLDKITERAASDWPEPPVSDASTWISEFVRQGDANLSLLRTLLVPLLDEVPPENGSPVDDADLSTDEAARIFNELSSSQISQLWNHDQDLFRKAINGWARSVTEHPVPLSELGEAGDFAARLIYTVDDPEILRLGISVLVEGTRRGSWRDRAALIAVLQEVRDPFRADLVLRALKECGTISPAARFRPSVLASLHPQLRSALADLSTFAS